MRNYNNASVRNGELSLDWELYDRIRWAIYGEAPIEKGMATVSGDYPPEFRGKICLQGRSAMGTFDNLSPLFTKEQWRQYNN